VIYGKGTALASDAIEFDRIYFEIQVKTTGKFAVGLAQPAPAERLKKELDKIVGDNKTSWGLRSDMLAATPEAQDVIGVFVDQSASPKMSFSLNGLSLGDLYDVPRPQSDMKIGGGQLFPAASVDKGASVEFHFTEPSFKYPPPAGYQTVIAVRDMIT
jgi:hypothetical protein